MSLSEAIATQPLWIQIWVGWIAIVNIATLAALLLKPTTRRDGVTVGIAFIANYMLMNWLYNQVGYTRLLGLSHILVWTPLVLYLILALRGETIKGWVRLLTQVFVVTICLSLAFDYTDVARWLMGERGTMLPGVPSDA